MENKEIKKEVVKVVELSDGRKAEILKGKGKDLFWAYQMANDPSEILKLLMVRLTLIDGKEVTEEVLEELDILDAMKLIRHFTELLTPLSPQKPS